MNNDHVEDEYRVKEKLNAKMKEGLNNEVKWEIQHQSDDKE